MHKIPELTIRKVCVHLTGLALCMCHAALVPAVPQLQIEIISRLKAETWKPYNEKVGSYNTSSGKDPRSLDTCLSRLREADFTVTRFEAVMHVRHIDVATSTH